MKSRSILILAVVSLVGPAIFRHWAVGTRMAQLDEQERRASGQRRRIDEEAAALLARIASDHAHLRALMAAPADQTKRPAKSAPAPAPSGAVAGTARNARIAGDPLLREMDVKAYVDGQKLKFGAGLAKLGLTPEQRQKFDAIQAEYEEHFLDLAAEAQERHLVLSDPIIASRRQQLAQVQEAEYQDLLGPAYGQWKESSPPPERAVITQIAEKALSGAGALAENQFDQLTEIMVANRRPGMSPSSAAAVHYDWNAVYDWNAIADQTTAILSPEQAESFKNAIDLILAESQMQIMEAGN